MTYDLWVMHVEPYVHDSMKLSMHLAILNWLFKNFVHTVMYVFMYISKYIYIFIYLFFKLSWVSEWEKKSVSLSLSTARSLPARSSAPLCLQYISLSLSSLIIYTPKLRSPLSLTLCQTTAGLESWALRTNR